MRLELHKIYITGLLSPIRHTHPAELFLSTKIRPRQSIAEDKRFAKVELDLASGEKSTRTYLSRTLSNPELRSARNSYFQAFCAYGKSGIRRNSCP